MLTRETTPTFTGKDMKTERMCQTMLRYNIVVIYTPRHSDTQLALAFPTPPPPKKPPWLYSFKDNAHLCSDSRDCMATTIQLKFFQKLWSFAFGSILSYHMLNAMPCKKFLKTHYKLHLFIDIRLLLFICNMPTPCVLVIAFWQRYFVLQRIAMSLLRVW